jgi:citrate synthase
VVIGTTISEIGNGWIRYRGHDLTDLVGRWRFEDVCRLLWTGELTADTTDADNTVGTATTAVTDAVERVVAALPAQASVSARLAAAAAAASPWVPRASTEPPAAEAASLVLDALVAALPWVGRPVPADGSVAERLWPRLSPLPATPERVGALDTALVVLAEHELATSTLAVRIAASTRAKPAEAVLTGLGTMSGPFHGRAAVAVHRCLATGADPGDTDLRTGFGHPVHEAGDPRFAPLLAPVTAIATDEQRAAIDRFVAPTRGVDPPNVDAALGALGFVGAMEVGRTEAVFAVARTAGWLAHAFEEADEAPVRFRGRTLYRGPR